MMRGIERQNNARLCLQWARVAAGMSPSSRAPQKSTVLVRLRVFAENAPIVPGLWMHSMIDLARATVIVDKALAQGRALGLPPLTVAVLDAGGCLVSFKREDGSSLLRPEIAQAKAWGALGMGIGSRAIAQPASVAPAFVSAVDAVARGRLTPASRGVL